MKKDIISGLFFLINIAFIVVSQLFFFEGNIVYNYIILIVLILLTGGYFLMFGNCRKPISTANIVIHFSLALSFAILVNISAYYIPFMKATYTFDTIGSSTSVTLFFNFLRLLSAKVKEKHLVLSKFLFIIGVFMFCSLFIGSITNIFSPGAVTNKL